MKVQYQEIKMRPESIRMIEVANKIIDSYQAQGYSLSLRQVYYQFVARDLFPDDRTWRWTGSKWVRDPKGTKNADPNYKWLGDLINNGRLAGLLDWDAIEDRTRNLQGLSHWSSPAEIMRSAYSSFKIDKWADQPNRIEVWVEKDALVGVLERVCNRHDVSYFACRGYVSQSEMWGAAQRLLGYVQDGQDVHILHLGDHDPSGIDMSRDIEDRLGLFMGEDSSSVTINRLALNWDQVEQYSPPPNPAKATDARFISYQRQFGDESWELDALEPSVIDALIGDQILDLRDDDLWDTKKAEEADHVQSLRRAASHWPQVAEYLATL